MPCGRVLLYTTGDSDGVNALGEPYEGKPHVRFDEGPGETQFGCAPPVYSTRRGPAWRFSSDVRINTHQKMRGRVGVGPEGLRRPGPGRANVIRR